MRPTEEEVDEWAERERKRRQAWLQGPSEDDKREWARRHRVRTGVTPEGSPVILEPTEEEVDDWAERERKRRQAWVKGPSEDEKREWERANRRGRYDLDWDLADDTGATYEELLRHARRDARLARAGIINMLLDWPYHLQAMVMRTGSDWETDYYEDPYQRRVPYRRPSSR